MATIMTALNTGGDSELFAVHLEDPSLLWVIKDVADAGALLCMCVCVCVCVLYILQRQTCKALIHSSNLSLAQHVVKSCCMSFTYVELCLIPWIYRLPLHTRSIIPSKRKLATCSSIYKPCHTGQMFGNHLFCFEQLAQVMHLMSVCAITKEQMLGRNWGQMNTVFHILFLFVICHCFFCAYASNQVYRDDLKK